MKAYQEFQQRERTDSQLIMLNFKIARCEDAMHMSQPQSFAFSCPNYHGNFDRRRALFDMQGGFRYSDLLCPNILQHQLLVKQCADDCQFSHNHCEESYHPVKYLTIQCGQEDHYRLLKEATGF